MSKPGIFMIKNFKDQPVDIWTSNESEEIIYAESALYNWTIFSGTLLDYDEESGVLVFEGYNKKRFYLNEWQVHLFAPAGTDFREFTKSTEASRKKKDRDIM